MAKQLIGFLFFAVLFYTIFKDEFITCEIDNYQNLQWPEGAKTIFFWDLHDVILKRNYRRACHIAWTYPHKLNVITNLIMIKKLAKMALQRTLSEAGAEEIIYHAHQQNLPHFAQFIQDIGNAQDQIEGTVKVIKTLYHQGYEHHLGSNIAFSIYQDLINPQKYPQFTELFSYFDLSKSHPVRYKNGTTTRKPDTNYFKGYLQKHNLDPKKTRIIFIDDKCVNIHSARQVGMLAIHFTTPENLRADLNKLGITTQ